MSGREELEIESHLKLHNKPPIRSIQVKSGQIVDCIDINRQPAFDHPLLKNHKIQRNPTFQDRRERTKEDHQFIRAIDFELEKVSCPVGSVPIRRTSKEDLIQMKYLSNHTQILSQGSRGLHDAALYSRKMNNDSYHGVNGFINIQNPRTKRHQTSIAQIGVQKGEDVGINTISFGWQVASDLYTRKTTNIFALWTSDSFKTTGCYNMLCRGFVQIDRNIYLGIRIEPTSSYGGKQYEISFSISQDPNTKNWWLIINDKHIGYYPATLFSNMSEADIVGWGGRVFGIVGGTSPQMGSGYFPDGDFSHSAFMRRISYYVSSGSLQEPQKNLLEIFVDNNNCYNLTYFGFLDNDNRHTFQFGGPGGQCEK
ncbi:hypothetical protein RIF29_32960 [Crotalaria pallida]|uniref:Neprosin PEP catalytic domain-containing protein n=1 Tax=Crotalaria pallida TaxID=3830 RepID=A0AAN9HSH6_CROPI